jgi:hypothetical protein
MIKPFLISRVSFAKSAILWRGELDPSAHRPRSPVRRARVMSRLIPKEAAMARIFPAVCPAMKDGAPVATAERQLFDRLARDLDAGWQVIHDCELRTRSEVISIAFVLLHRDYGIALLGIAEPGKVEDPDLAIAAMHSKLEEIGFTRRYRGHVASPISPRCCPNVSPPRRPPPSPIRLGSIGCSRGSLPPVRRRLANGRAARRQPSSDCGGRGKTSHGASAPPTSRAVAPRRPRMSQEWRCRASA